MQDEKQAVNQQTQNTIDKTNQEIQGENSQPADAGMEQMPKVGIGGNPIQEVGQQEVGQQEVGGNGQNARQSTDPIEEDVMSFLDSQMTQKAQEQEGVQKGQFATEEYQLGDVPQDWELERQNDFMNIPHYDKYEGSAWSDFYNSTMNAGVVRTAQGLANLIPAVASAVTDADWAKGWMDTVNDWADRSEGYVSQTGNKSFFETWDVRSLAAGMGQGVGSMIPMVVAAAGTAATGGAGAPVLFGAMTAGTAAGMAASSINMMPSIIEEGLANGLTHQQASALALSIAPVVGLMDKVGLDEAVKAGLTATGGISKEVLKQSFETMTRKGLSSKNFAPGTVKMAIGEIAMNQRARMAKELAELGIEKGAKGYRKKMIGATAKGIGQELKFNAKATASAGIKGSLAEASTEGMQSLIETAGKQIYDLQFASDGSTVGKGKFGADIMSEEAWMAALEEGFYGGLIGGSFASAGAVGGVRSETVTSALDSAAKRGRLDKEKAKMVQVIDNNAALSDVEKSDLKEIVETAGKMVQSMPEEVTNSKARHQIFQLSHFARQLQGEIDKVDVENATIGMEDLALAKKDKLERRMADTKRAISDIYATTQETNELGDLSNPGGRAIDLDETLEDGQKKYFLNQITGLAVQSKQAIRTGSKPVEVTADKAKASEMRMEGQLGRLEKDIDAFAERIAKGEDLSSAEDQQFYANNKQFIEERLKQMQQVPAVTATQEVALQQDFDEINPAISKAQDEDLEYINRSAEESHRKTYGDDTATRLNSVIDDIASDDTLLNDDFTVKEGITGNQRNQLVNKLVTARRAVLEMIESAPTQEAKENLANFDNLLRQKIQQAKALEVSEDTMLGEQKRIGDEQTKIAPKSTVSAKITKTTSTTEQKTEDGTRQIEETKSTQKRLGEAQPSAKSGLKTGELDGDASPQETPKEKKAKSLGFKSWRHALNSVNKRRKERGEAALPVTQETFESLTDRQLEVYAKMSKSAKLKDVVSDTKETMDESPAPTPEGTDDGKVDGALSEDEKTAAAQQMLDEMWGDADADFKFAKAGKSALIKENRESFNAVLNEVRRMFPDVDIEVLEKVFTRDGIEALGRVFENRIQLSEDKATQDVLFHELAHKFAPILSGARVWKRGLDIVKGTPFMDEAKELYPELDEDGQAEEALVSMIGERSMEMMEAKLGKDIMPKVKAWLKQFWNRLKYVLGKANANDMASIMAWDLAMKNKPVEGTGISIGGEKLAKLYTKESKPTFNAIKVAAIKTKIWLKSHPEVAAQGMASILYDKNLERAHQALVNSKETTKSFEKWKADFEGHIDFFRDNVEIALDNAGVDAVFDIELSEDADTDNKLKSFVDGGEKLDDNVRSILESLTDDSGNALPIARVYGVLTHVASLNTDPAYYLSSLDKFAKQEGTSSIDKAVAEQLSGILSTMPQTVVTPVQAQLSSIVNVPHINLSFGRKGGLFSNFSNNKINAKVIGDIIQERILATFTSTSSKGNLEYRAKTLENLRKESISLYKKIGESGFGYKELKRINDLTAMIETDLQAVTGSPITISWFGKGKSSSIEGTYRLQMKNIADFAKALQESDAILQKAYESATDNKSLQRAKVKTAIQKSKSKMSRYTKAMASEIDSSYGERTVFRNVLGNQQMAYKVGGLMHKMFSNKAMFDRDWTKHKSIGHLGKETFKKYTDNWKQNAKNNNPNVAHSDGMVDANGKGVQYDKMNDKDKLFYKMSTMFGTLDVTYDKKGNPVVSYMNSVGTLSNRKFMAFASMPLLSTKEAKSLRAKLDAESNGVPDGARPSLEFVKDNEKDIADFLTKLAADQPLAFESMISALAPMTRNDYQNKLHDDNGFDWNSINAIEANGLSAGRNKYISSLKGLIPDVAERMAYNEVNNRFLAKSMLLGDLSEFGSSNDILKRIDKTTSPVVNYDLRENPKDKQPETITIVLEEVLHPDGKTKVSDSWGYFSPYLGSMIKKQGGALIDYGNNHKPLINDIDEDGNYTQIKFAAQSFNGKYASDIDKYHKRYTTNEKGERIPVVNEDGTPALDQHGRIGKALQDLQQANPGVPIVVTYASAVKSSKDPFKKGAQSGRLATLKDLEDAAKTGNLNDINHTKKVYTNFGAQFNINKQVTKQDKDGNFSIKGGQDVSLSTQLLNVITAGLPADVNIDTFQEILGEMTSDKVNNIVKGLKDKGASIKEALKAAGQGVSPFVSDLLTEIVETKGDELADMKFDHYDIASVLQRWLAAQVSKGVKHRVSGAELLQTTDLDGDLKYMNISENGQEITYADVKVPEGFAEVGEELISVRIPLSNKINIVVARVVGHTAPDGNQIVMPEGWIKASNSDNDGDKMFTWKKSGKGKADQLFDEGMKLLRHPSLWSENGGYKEELDTKKVQQAVWEAEAELGIHESPQAAEEAFNNQELSLGSMRDEDSTSDKLAESDKLIGIFAVGAKVVNALATAGVELADKTNIKLPGAFAIAERTKGGRGKFTTEKISQVAESLQGALDDAKSVFMHKTGFNRDNANMAVLLMSVGYDLKEVVKFFRHPAVERYTEILKDNKTTTDKSVHTDPKKIRAKITNEITQKYEGAERIAKIKEANVMLDAYNKLKSQSALIKAASTITQMDKGTAQDNIALMDYDAKRAQLESYLEGGDRNIVIAKMGTFLDNPVAKSRHAAQNSFRDILKRYFSAITTDKTTEGLLGETLDSLTDLDTNKKSKVSQKAWSKTIALDMSNYKYSNEALVEMADSLINTVQNLKLDPNHINQGWLNLIGFEFKKDEFDLDVPVKLIPTYRNSPTPELDLDEAGQVNQAFLEKHWDSMDAELREQILEYAVHAEGLINEGHNITHLIPSKVFKRYLDKMSKVNTEEVMTEQFMDNIVREGRASVKEVVGIEIDTAAPNTLSGLSLENKPSKYFKVVQDGDEYIYKTTGKPTFDSSTKKWVADANLLVSPNDIVRVANRDIVQYSINDNNKPAADFSPISADEIHTQEQNQRASVGEDVSNQLEMMFPSDNDVDLQIPVESRNENASKVNKRLLRRLSNKFNIPFKVINDPDFKVAGFYDAATNTVVINEAYAKADTPIHEFAHPFIKSIKSRNPELYNSLIAQLNSSEEGRAALDRVQELYAQNTLEQQQEEALVQLLGELAADKLTNKTLIEQLTELFNQIKNIVKGLFGAQADIIQEKMNADMTLGELADIVIDSSKSVDIDTQMDDRFRRAMDYAARSVERLEKMFNPAVAVVKASELMSSDIQAEHSKIKALGFLSNNNYVVKRKGVANENVDVLSFRVPIKDITVWKDKMASIYPEFKITEKSNAPVNGFDMYEVSIGGDSNAYIYVPKNNRAFHPGSIAHANIDFQMAAGSTKSSKRVNNNSDVFGGLGFDLDEFEVSDLEFGNSGQERNRLVKGFWNDVLIELNLDDDKISPAMRAVLVRDVIAKAKKQASDNFDKVAKKGKLSGSLKDVVYMKDIEQSQVNSPDNWIEYFKYGTINATADQEFVNAVQSFERMLEVTMFLDANSDYLIKDGKRVSSSKVAKDIIDRSNNASSQRADFFEKFPVVGKLYSTITKTLSGLRNFTLNMFTPEVMANVVTGDEKNFLHQLVNDDMIDADAKDAKFKQEVMDGFRERLPKEMQSQVSKFSDWLSADPKDAKTIAIKGLSSKVPVGKALSLYLALRQSDVKAKLTNPKTGEVNVALFDEVTQKEKKATVNAEKFIAQFETQMANNPELGALVGAIDGTMTEIHDRVNPAVKNFIGVDLGKVANYFPIRYGSRSGLKVDSEKRRIEDFTGIKERSLDNMGGIRMDDAFQMIDSYVNQASKFNAYAEPISNLRKVIQEIERQGDESHEGTVAYIYDMIDNIQDYRQLQSLSDASWDKKIRQGMNNFTLAVLGWNPAVALKQVVSIVAAAPELGLSVVKSKEGRATAMRILKTSYKDSKIGKGQIGQLNLNDDTLKEIMDLDPLMRERFQGYIDRDQGEYRSSGMNPFSKEGKKTTIFGKKMDMSKTMEMIKIHDAAAIAWIFEDIKSKNPGISKDALRKKLRQTVMRTQPTYNVSSRTNLSRSNNPLMRLFTMFSSQRAKNMNMMVDSIVKYATNPDERSKQNMKATLLAIGVLSSIGIAVIDKFKYLLFGGGGDDEDALDIAADIGAMSMLNTLGNIYFVGQFSQMVDANIRNKPFGKSVEHPVFQTVGIAAKGVADLTKGDVFKAADGAIQTGMRVMGAPLWPYTNIVRKGAKAIGSEDGSGKSSKSSESNTPKKEQGEVMTATERAAQLSARTQLIKADMAGKRAVMELVAKREAMESRERIAAMRARTALAIEAAKDRRAESKEEK